MHYVNPFAQSGQWYRGNTHIHSSVSDGVRSIAECCEGYRQQYIKKDHCQILTIGICGI